MRPDIVDPPINPLIKKGTGQGEALTDLRKARPEHIFGLEGGKALESISGLLGGAGGAISSAVPKAVEAVTSSTPSATLFKNDLA